MRGRTTYFLAVALCVFVLLCELVLVAAEGRAVKVRGQRSSVSVLVRYDALRGGARLGADLQSTACVMYASSSTYESARIENLQKSAKNTYLYVLADADAVLHWCLFHGHGGHGGFACYGRPQMPVRTLCLCRCLPYVMEERVSERALQMRSASLHTGCAWRDAIGARWAASHEVNLPVGRETDEARKCNSTDLWRDGDMDGTQDRLRRESEERTRV